MAPYLPLKKEVYNRMRFTSDLRQLQSGLFSTTQSRFGAQTSLNINFIPDLLQHIKQQLTSLQLIRLEDYHLQNYLMELSIHYQDKRTLSAIVQTILTHIRSNNNFWYRHNNQEQIQEEQELKQHAIVRYHQDVKKLQEMFADVGNRQPFNPSYKRRTTQVFTFQLLHSKSQPHFGTRQPLNHLAFIPSFLCQQLANKGERENRQLMEECIVFLLSNKTDTVRVAAKQSPKDNSDQAEEEEENSESQADDDEVSEEQEKTVLDQFLEYVENEASLPKFPNSHHMHVLTYNLINACIKVHQMHQQEQQNSEEIYSKNAPFPTASSPLKIITLDDQLKECLSLITERNLVQQQIQLISRHFLHLWRTDLAHITRDMRRKQKATLSNKGWLNTAQEIARVKQSYQQMLDNPDFMQLNKYRAIGAGIPWKQQDYLKFLKGLNEYLNIPTNNKKIASFMGDGYEPNHVKHVKGVYLTVMKERMERGECGGGKRGKSLSKSDFIDKDINNFSIRWFEKAKKIKKKKPKKKRRNSDSDEGEEEPDSQY